MTYFTEGYLPPKSWVRMHFRASTVTGACGFCKKARDPPRCRNMFQMDGHPVPDDEPEPTIEEIRAELDRCVDLIHSRAAVEAATRLTRLRWRLERSSSEIPGRGGREPRKRKTKPVFAWEYEQSMHPAHPDPDTSSVPAKEGR